MPLEPHRLTAPSHLYTSRDVGVTWRINQALEHDPRTKGRQIQVNAVEGRIRLLGYVDDPAVREAAGAIVSALPGVHGFFNELRVVHGHHRPL